MSVTNNKDHQHLFGQSTSKSGGEGKWRDLGDSHIVRAASVYTNIPLSKTKQLSAVLKKAQDRTFVQLSARAAVREITGSANADKSNKKRAPVATLHQYKDRKPRHNDQIYPQETPMVSSRKAAAIKLEMQQEESSAAEGATGYDSKLSKSMHADLGNGSLTSAAPSHTSQIEEPRDPIVSALAQVGDESAVADCDIQQMQSAEFSASCDAYYGQQVAENDRVSKGTSLISGTYEQSKRNTASMGVQRGKIGINEEENLNLVSPSANSTNYNSKSSKQQQQYGQLAKNNRRKQTQRQSKGGPTTLKKGAKKRIDEMGSVYEQRTHMVPGATGGSVVRTSTQNLRNMTNSNGGQNQKNHGSAGGNDAMKIERRRAQEIEQNRFRMLSQSPSLAYECSSGQNYTVSNLLSSKVHNDYIKLQNTHEKKPYSIKNRGNKTLISHEDNTTETSHARKNHSLSCRSGKSSLPEIGNRSMHEQTSTVGNAANGSNVVTIADEIVEDRQFYPVQELVEQFTTSNANMTVSQKGGEGGVIFSRQEQQEISLHYENNISGDNLVSLNSSAFADNNTNENKGFVNLPCISKQNTSTCVKEEFVGTTAAKSQQSSRPDSDAKQPLGQNQFAQRTNSMNRSSGLNDVIVPSASCQKMQSVSLTGLRHDKVQRSNNQVLHPLQISEVAPSKETMGVIERASSLEKLQSTKQDAKVGGLKPLNHTPILRKHQTKPLAQTISKSGLTNANVLMQQQQARTAADFRKVNNSIGRPRRSLGQETPHQSNLRLTSKDTIEDGAQLSPSLTYGECELDVKQKASATTTATKDMHVRNLSKSPMRGISIDRSAPGAGGGIRKEQRDGIIIAQSLNAEPFYRRAIRRLGWKEASQSESQRTGFHIRFAVGDLEGSTKDLQSRHFYNHFPQNREIVTKMGLCKNLWFQCFTEQEQRVSNFFPRCYDLSVPQQAETFLNDFNQTAILSTIKIMANSFMSLHTEDMNDLFTEYARIALFTEPERFFKPHFKRKCAQLDVKNSPAGNLLGIGEVYLAYAYAKELSNLLQYKEPKKQRTFSRASQQRQNDRQIQTIVAFQTELVEKGVPIAGFATYEQFKIVRLHRTLMELMPQYRQIDGTHNIWIVKPSYNARGVGIYCTRQLSEIIKHTDKSQQKVVQKYIERPFCVEGQRKFDFRQWVLVNSWEPLDICVFQSAYLKVCGNAFDLKQVHDVYRHLSNYSIQKENGEKEELVMSSAQFEAFMRTTKPELANFTWSVDMLPKINDVVWRTLKGVQENFEQKSNTFEVYGFDIVLDEDLNPWVIEVNLSPACNERTEWLTQMLNDSCIDLLRHIQSRILTAHPTEQWMPDLAQLREQAASAPHKTTKYLNPKTFYEEFEIQDRWVRLPESIQEIKEFYSQQAMAPQKGLQLELCGEKADLRFERKLDRQYRSMMSAIEIQRLYRGHCGRKIFIAALRNRSAIRIQKDVRVFLAKLELHRLRQKRAATIVQNQLRRRLAQKLANKLDEERIFALKTVLVTKLQTRYRMTKAKDFVHTVRQDQASRRCQKYIRGFISRKMALLERTKRCMIIRIQRFYKRRYQQKQKSARTVQKILKKRIVQKRVAHLKRVVKGATKLRHLIQTKYQSGGLTRLRCHNKVITLQSYARMWQMKKLYKSLIQQQAQARLRAILRRHIIKNVSNIARTCKVFRDNYATIVQKYMKGVLAKKRVAEMRQKILMNDSATVVKRFMKGYLGKKEAKRQRIKIGASIMIQSLIRGFLTRRREMKKKEELIALAVFKKTSSARLQVDKGAAAGKYKSRAHQSTKSAKNATQKPKDEEHKTRYQSNPPKFTKNPTQKQKQQQLQGAAARKLVANASQNSLVQSNTSLRRSETDISSQLQNQSKFASNQSGAKKTRKPLKKSGRQNAVGGVKNEYHFELGLRHIQQQQYGLQDKLTKAQRATQHEAIFAKAAAKEKRYALQDVRHDSATQLQQQQRLGQRIVQSLQQQKIQNLGLASQARSGMPLRTQYGDERFDRLVMGTFEEGHHANNLIATQQPLELPSVELTASQVEQVTAPMIIETRKSVEVSSNHCQNAVQTPIVKCSSNGFAASKNNSLRNSNGQNSTSKLPLKRNGAFNLPTGHIRILTSVGIPQMRSSIETTTTTKIIEGEKVVARGLGKDQDVTATQQTLESNRSGCGQATTIVMRKNPSKASLHSNTGRNSKTATVTKEALEVANSGTTSQHRQQLALAAQIDSEQISKQQQQQTHQNARSKAKQSKQLKNLEKLVQHGAPYIQQQARSFNNRGGAAAQGLNQTLREKIAEQQRQLTTTGLQALKSANKGSLKTEQQKSFAKYLGEMLSSQARQTDSSFTGGGAEIIQTTEITASNNYESFTKSNGAFSSSGKGSLNAVRMHQPEFKPMRKNGRGEQHDGVLTSSCIVPTTSINATGLPNVLTATAPSDVSRNATENALGSARAETLTSFASRNDHDDSSREPASIDAGQKPSSRHTQRKSYSQAQTAFNKTKNGYLDQIRKDQERRYQAISDAHKSSQNIILLSSQNGTAVPQQRPDSRDNQTASTVNREGQGQVKNQKRHDSRSFHTKRASKISASNMVVI